MFAPAIGKNMLIRQGAFNRHQAIKQVSFDVNS